MRLLHVVLTVCLSMLLVPVMFAQEVIPQPARAEMEKSREDIEIERLTKEKNRIAAEIQLRMEKLMQSLADMTEEQKKLEIENRLAQERQTKASMAAKAASVELQMKHVNAKAEIGLATHKLQMEKATLALQNAISQEIQKRAIADLSAEVQKMKLEMEREKSLQGQALRNLQVQKDRIALQNQLAAEEYAQTIAGIKNENQRINLEMEKKDILLEKAIHEITAEKKKLDAENARLTALKKNLDLKFQMQQEEITQKLAELESGITLRKKQDDWRSEVNRDIEYVKEPFKDGVLTISDRRIPLNDVIIEGTADFITKRIHYLNNQSTEDPIFIVIDRCPGGSVMEGYRIIKAMQASKAPIHVVVKTFAASMAATILTLADHSYAYPNAIVLHHQPFGVTFGNITQQDEQIKIFKEWAKRLHTPVAKKMKLTLDEFYKRMYKKNSDGDWQEFADAAHKLRWVDNIAMEIREEGYTKNPTDEPPRPFRYYLWSKDEAPDPKNDFMQLPRLKPFDCYFIYNPNSYYRWP